MGGLLSGVIEVEAVEAESSLVKVPMTWWDFFHR